MKALLPAILIALCAAAPASAQIEFPASWAGIWEITSTDFECGTSNQLDMYTETDTICAGDVFDPGQEVEGAVYICSGGIDDTTIDITCAITTEVAPGCDVTFTINTTGTRTGDSFEGTDTFSITYEGDCFGLQDSCTESEVTGTRTGPAPPECATVSTEPATWGHIKDLYR